MRGQNEEAVARRRAARSTRAAVLAALRLRRPGGGGGRLGLANQEAGKSNQGKGWVQSSGWSP